MAIDKEIKKKVVGDWQNAFPQLTLYEQVKLYKVVGSVVIGLELITLPMRTGEYRPYFVVYPLWRKDVKTSLDTPIILREYYNNKGLQYNVPYEKHGTLFNELSDRVKKQTPLAFHGNISYKEIASVLDDYSQTFPLSAAPNSYLQAALQEAKLKIALFVGVAEAQSVLEQINKRTWDVNHFKAFDVDVSDWLQSLQAIIPNRNEFLKQIEANKRDKKISNLKNSELTL
jgi:hypothetical protein